MKNFVPSIYICACASLILSWSSAVSQTTSVSGDDALYLAYDLPSGWHENSRSETPSTLTIEYTKDTLGSDGVGEKLTVQVIRDHHYGSLEAATNHFAQFMRAACEVTATTVTSNVPNYVTLFTTYPEYFQYSECLKFKERSYGESIMNRLISTPLKDYILQYSWRYPGLSVPKDNIQAEMTVKGGRHLYTFVVCDVGSHEHACGSKMLHIK